MRKDFLAVCCILSCAAAPQNSEPLGTGKVIPRVVCAANPEVSYSLYLPAAFSAKKRWPVIYAFDPSARGAVAVEAIRAAAEKYGYIVVASNNSRNFMEAESTNAAKAMWQDTQQRFPIDEHRRYFAGMSGGARLATALAISCAGCLAGVIANAAGFPVGREVPPKLEFAYFAAVGNADFNFAEFVELRRKLEGVDARYKIRVFDGAHGWAPEEVWFEALDWMDMQAMRAKLMESDAGRIDRSYKAAMERADKMLSQGDALGAWREYSFAVRDYSGLTGIAEAQTKAADLANDKRVKSGLKEEASAAADQDRLMAEPSEKIQSMSERTLGAVEMSALRDSLATMQRDVAHSGKDDSRMLVRRRALAGLVIQAFESGQSSMERKRYDAALNLFDLVIAGSENPGWGHYHRARAYAAKSDKKHMLGELGLAAQSGFRDVSALEAPEFGAFRSDPEFQMVLQEWKASDK